VIEVPGLENKRDGREERCESGPAHAEVARVNFSIAVERPV